MNSPHPSPLGGGSRLRSLVILLLSFAVGSGVLAQPPEAAHELRPGLVIDSALGMAFTMNPGGGIDAIELASGNVRWHSDEADKPLAISGGLLTAQAASGEPGRLDLAALDASGGQRRGSGSIELPRGVRALVVDGIGAQFQSWARATTGAAVEVGWQYEESHVQGIRPAGRGRSPSSFSGALRFDVARGSTEALPTDAGRPQAVHLLSASQGVSGQSGRQFVSVDGRHVLVSDQVADDRTFDKYRWVVYTREGSRLGELSSFVSYSPFGVTGSLLLFSTPPNARRVGEDIRSEPLLLRAVDLRSGAELWSHAIRDTKYRGPLPR